MTGTVNDDTLTATHRGTALLIALAFGAAPGDGPLVPDDPAREAGQNRSPAGATRAAIGLADGGGGGDARPVCTDPQPHQDVVAGAHMTTRRVRCNRNKVSPATREGLVTSGMSCQGAYMTVHELKTVRWELSIAETFDLAIAVWYNDSSTLSNQRRKGMPKSDMGNPGQDVAAQTDQPPLRLDRLKALQPIIVSVAQVAYDMFEEQPVHCSRVRRT